MNVLFVTPYFHPRDGGLERYSYEMARGLVEQYGAEVSVICCDWGSRTGESEGRRVDGIDVHHIPYVAKVSTTPVAPYWKRSIGDLITRIRPDIVNGHTPVPFIADVAARVCSQKDIPFILTYHNDLVGDGLITDLLSPAFQRLWGNRTLELSDLIITTSLEYARSSIPLREHIEKVRVVPPGVNPEDFYKGMSPAPNDESEGGIGRVLFVGQLNKASRHKGLNYLIDAIGIVSVKMEVQLVVVGRGDNMHRYRELAEARGVRDRVHFTGYVSQEALPSFFHGSDIVVLPSYNRAEGFGIVLLEGQACGKPVIGTTVGGIPAAIEDGLTGILVPPRDAKALADAIVELLSDRERARSMGNRGRTRVEEQFTWKRSAVAFHDVVQEALTRHGG